MQDECILVSRNEVEEGSENQDSSLFLTEGQMDEALKT